MQEEQTAPELIGRGLVVSAATVGVPEDAMLLGRLALPVAFMPLII